jgi:hypothetical protein
MIRKIFIFLFCFLTILSIISSFVEYQESYKQYLLGLNEIKNGSWNEKFKNEEEIVLNRLESSKYYHSTLKSKFFLDLLIVFLGLVIFFFLPRKKHICTNQGQQSPLNQ